MGPSQTDHRQIPTGITVAVLTAFARPDEGGIQRSVEQIANALAPDVVLVAPPHPTAGEYDRSRSYPVIRRHLFGGPGFPTWFWILGWGWRMKRRGLRTILFGHASGACFLVPMLTIIGVRSIILVHGRDLLAEEARRTKWLMRWALRSSDWIGVNSTYTAEFVRTLGVSASRIVRTHPAVTDEVLKRPTTPKPKHILTVGRLVKRKNIQRVIDAIKLVTQTHPDVRYDIVGDGPEREALERLIEQQGLHQYVKLHGAIDDATRDQLFDQAEVFVMIPHTSNDPTDVEGLGLVYLEAIARGLPCIASDNGGVKDVVDPKYGHRLVDPNDVDAIARAITDMFDPIKKPDPNKIRERARQEFTWSVRNGRLLEMVQRRLAPGSIDIVIPAFQSARTIGRTLDSIFSQTLRPHRVIVVDDGSTDDLEKALAPWRSELLYIQQPNAGAAAARNRGAHEATAEYIIFVDADTTFRPFALASMLLTLRLHPEAAYAYPSFRFGPKGFHLFDFDDQRLRQMNFIHTSALIRRERFPGFDQNLKRFQDWDLWLTMLSRGDRGIWVPAELFRVDQRGGTMSAWLPSFVYRLPWLGRGVGLPNVDAYREAEKVIRTKHRLAMVAD